MDKAMLDLKECAYYINISPNSLRMAIHKGHLGPEHNPTPLPKWVKIGGKVLFRVSDVDEWMEQL